MHLYMYGSCNELYNVNMLHCMKYVGLSVAIYKYVCTVSKA